MSATVSPQEVIASLERDDVLHALAEIRAEKVPAKRRSRKFCVRHDRRHYPPKLAISFASAFRYADDPEMHRGLDPAKFAGGPQSNGALRRLGFAVIECDCGGTKAFMAPAPARRSAKGPAIARVVVNGKAALDPRYALRCIGDVFQAMREAKERADIVITPGGFIELDLRAKVLPLGWNTPTSALADVSKHAEAALQPFLAGLKHLDATADFLTLGVDCMLKHPDWDYPMAELVATIEMDATTIIGWTGKSYPTSTQEENLLHVTDLDSHLQTVGKWRCLVLGCHDLNMLSPRSVANRDAKSRRGRRADDLICRAKAFIPEVVLQHPHTTDTPNIWMGGWAGVKRMLKPTAYASGICYYNPATPKRRRADLDEVLSRTRVGNVSDYVWSGAGKVSRAKAT
jgi:hypothetical protein